MTYKEPFIKAWNKLLKELFTNLLNNVQPIQINLHVGTGWDWLNKVPVDGTIITIDITIDEIIQCNYSDTYFNCYVNFGKVYKFLEIPYNSIQTIFIGNENNWVTNPVNTIPLNLNKEIIDYLNNFGIDEEIKIEEEIII